MLFVVVLALATGARQLVVQDALDTTAMSGVYLSWFTPITNIGASPEGAEMTTFFAPPGRMVNKEHPRTAVTNVNVAH